ncbi:helix-turn-helix domain-containing protein [Lactococcus petauri]|uniref:helix-turn-helix domain-containing protein n=1 Tax=Lactococcus petauri TaxID=1940789 RepID=UPI0018ABC4CB|nr:XRE family transcriptional regulator [Lactococcus petauri]MDC0826071.1 XRE family transcriptional regulator [Lactococcus petauri]
MTKTKLQIMREKKGLTIDQLAKKVVEIDKDIRAIHEANIIQEAESQIYCKGFDEDVMNANIESWAKALGCSVDELVEE